MIDSILEFIARAASSSAFIFCFCNLIIIIILIDLKPILSLDQESKIPVSMNRNTAADDKQEGNSKCLVVENKPSPEAGEVSPPQEDEVLTVDKVENENNDDCSNEKVEEEEENDDELRRRVEEFIEKVNKGWKAEMFRPSDLV